MDLVAAISGRRTIRFYQQRPVEKEKLFNLIEAARMAPSAANAQPLRYVVVMQPELVAKLFAVTKWAGRVTPRRTPQAGVNAPPVFLAITCKANTDPQVDAGSAIAHLVLSAYAQGLGCCWIGAFDHAAADLILGLSENVRTLYLVAVGYPAEKPVRDDIPATGNVGYYLDNDDILHVPKYTVDALTEWR